MENYSPFTGADLEMVRDADNTLRAANQTLPKSKTKCCFSTLPTWREKILPGGHGCLWSGWRRIVEFLPALPLLSALYLVIWCSSCRSFSFTQQKIQHHNLLCHSLLICIKILSLLTLKFSLLILILSVCGVLYICPMKYSNYISFALLLIQYQGRAEGRLKQNFFSIWSLLLSSRRKQTSQSVVQIW